MLNIYIYVPGQSRVLICHAIAAVGMIYMYYKLDYIYYNRPGADMSDDGLSIIYKNHLNYN